MKVPLKGTHYVCFNRKMDERKHSIHNMLAIDSSLVTHCIKALAADRLSFFRSFTCLNRHCLIIYIQTELNFYIKVYLYIIYRLDDESR